MANTVRDLPGASWLLDAFRLAERPSAPDLVGHECEECDELRNDLLRFTNRTLPVDAIRSHFGDLALLTDLAFRYFLPAYISVALDGQPGTLDEQVREFVLFSLYPSGEHADSEYILRRLRPLTPEELNAVLQALERLASDPKHEYDHTEAREAIEWWRTRLLPSLQDDASL